MRRATPERRSHRRPPPANLFDRLRPLHRVVRPFEVAQVRRFGRSVLSLLHRTPVLVLETTGRRSGAPRRTALAYRREGADAVLVVGGSGGQTRTPDWVANLRAAPDVVIHLDGRRRVVRAEELHGPERADVWAVLRRTWPRIDTYERRAGRPVPVFRLTQTTPPPRGPQAGRLP